jgi:hypothetical protein
MVWVLSFEILLALIIGFVVLRSVGRGKIFAVTDRAAISGEVAQQG